MYGLPDDFDPALFLGRTLERLEFTTNTIIFRFDYDTTIVIEGEVQHEGVDEHEDPWVQSTTLPVSESRLTRLLGTTIVAGSVEGAGNLVLQFSNRHTLRCVEDSDQYESYQLRIGTTEIIV
jgi:hypothetical protein